MCCISDLNKTFEGSYRGFEISDVIDTCSVGQVTKGCKHCKAGDEREDAVGECNDAGVHISRLGTFAV